ncbi:GNAT family N-acetyltransferase [Cryptosporangium sp. NPDC051539]|uniref:GNAT family N-acetyltransferase n=1 Tax=Cryptosporangium sp. NPDC051539 TaxID=3363962 RepID=UPI003789B78E
MTADMLLLRISPPAAPGPAAALLRRCLPDAEFGPGRWYLLVDVAAEDPHQALAAALVRPENGLARLIAIAVEPGQRGRGLGARLLADVRRSVHAAGEVLELRTDADGRLTNILPGLGFAEDPEPGDGSYAAEAGGRPVRWLSRDI